MCHGLIDNVCNQLQPGLSLTSQVIDNVKVEADFQKRPVLDVKLNCRIINHNFHEFSMSSRILDIFHHFHLWLLYI